MKDLVSIIVLNWNGREYIRSCVEHVLNQTYWKLEIIVVDNGSTDGSIEFIQTEYPGLRFIKNETNLGFCKGMNQGIGVSDGAYVILLNQDAFLSEDFVERAIGAAEKDERIGMVGGKIYRFMDGQKTTDINHVGHFLRKRVAHTNSRNSTREEFVFGPTGCCPFLKREMLEDVRLSSGEYYDESYFAYGEDLDLWFRAQLRGWKCLFVPDVIAWHVHSGSLEGKIRLIEKPSGIQIHALKNRYLTIVKDFPLDLLLYLLPYLILAEFAIWPYFLLKRPRNLVNLFIAWWNVLTLIPDALQKRRRIQSAKVMPSSYLKQFFIEF